MARKGGLVRNSCAVFYSHDHFPYFQTMDAVNLCQLLHLLFTVSTMSAEAQHQVWQALKHSMWHHELVSHFAHVHRQPSCPRTCPLMQYQPPSVLIHMSPVMNMVFMAVEMLSGPSCLSDSSARNGFQGWLTMMCDVSLVVNKHC